MTSPSRKIRLEAAFLACLSLLGAAALIGLPERKVRPDEDRIGALAPTADQRIEPAGHAQLIVLLDALVDGARDGAPLTEVELADLRTTLIGQPSRRLLGAIDDWIESPAEPTHVVLALGLLADVAEARDVDLFLEVLARAANPGNAQIEAVFVEALALTIKRDPDAIEALSRSSRKLPPSQVELVVAAIGAAGLPEGLTYLAGELGRGDVSDEQLLRAIATLADRLAVRPDAEVVASVRPFLESSSSAEQQLAILALGNLQDEEVVPDLVDLLAAPSRGIANKAERALQAITGLNYRGDVGRWRSWLEKEQAWWENEAKDVLASLESPEEGDVFSALRVLARHRMRRYEAAESVLFLLDDGSRALRIATCQTLAQIGSRAATASLAERVVLDEEAVAQAAWGALRTITGHDVPLDDPYWEELAGR